MKEILESFDVVYFLAAVTGISLLLKFISFILYKRLLRDSNQMATTDNKWMKSMMAKFEAYYKLKISVHNVENFVDRYIYRYHFLGLSLQSWEYISYYAAVVTVAAAALCYLAAGYYGLAADWFLVMGFCVLSLLLIQAAASAVFNIHRCRKIFRIQLIDYMENTMRARLENEYLNQEATQEYRMEYFEEDKGKSQAAAAMEAKETGEFVPRKLAAGSGQKEGQRESLDMLYGDGRPSKPFSYGENQIHRQMPPTDRIRDGREREGKAASDIPLPPGNGLEIRELLTSLLEELQIDRDIAKKQKEITDYAAEERAQLFEEILREYI